jgi:thiol:disulfide interchange protein DsbD
VLLVGAFASLVGAPSVGGGHTAAVARHAAARALGGGLAEAAGQTSRESGQIVRPRAAVIPYVETDRVHSGTEVRVALQVSLPEGLHVQSNAPRDPSLIATLLRIEPPAGITVDEPVYPPATNLKQVGQDQPLAVFEREFVIGAHLTMASGLPAGDVSVPLHLRYQACDATVCYPPATAEAQWSLHLVAVKIPTGTVRHRELFDRIGFGGGPQAVLSPPGIATPPARPQTAGRDNGVAELDRFSVLATPTGGYLGRDEFLRFIHDAESGTKQRGLFEGRGPLAILLIVFLGGLALNLTPCVLPMIPINLAIIGAGAQAGSRGRGFVLGSVYGAAMALVYGVLGLVVILTAGTFGTINASPWFNIGIAVLFVVLGLAMFDVIMIDFSRIGSGFRASDNRRGTVLLAFSMGSIAALLAGACVAPVVIQVVLFSSNLYATGTRVALALPFCLGIGMAVPWPIAGAGLAALPKPGAWMVRVKQVLGIVILGTAVYYGYLAFELLSNRWVDGAAVASSVDEKIREGWHNSLAAGLAAAERDRKPVLIDMWATWCKNCLTMDKTTLENPEVKAALSGYIKIKFQAEDPDRTPAKDVMQRFGAVGLPTYVILRPKAATP